MSPQDIPPFNVATNLADFPAQTQLHRLHSADFSLHDLHAQQRAHPVEPVRACRPRIDEQAAPPGIALHPQDVAVAAQEDVRAFGLEPGAYARGVAARMSADVDHRTPQSGAVPNEPFRASTPHPVVVDVAIDGPDGGHGGQPVEHLEAADVAGVPDFCAALEVVEDAVVEVAVGVGKDADAHGGEFGPIFGPKHIMNSIQVFLATLALALPVLSWSQPGQAQSGGTTHRRAQQVWEDAREFARRGEFAEAMSRCEKALAFDPEFFNARLLKAEIHESLGQLAEAAAEGLNAQRSHPALWNDWRQAWRVDLLFRAGTYEEARKAAAELSGWEPMAEEDILRWKRLRASVEYAAFAHLNPVESPMAPLPGSVNTPLSEYYPALTLDGQTMLFTRRIQGAYDEQEDFFWAHNSEGIWTDEGPVLGVNTSGNEGAAALRGDGRIVVFTSCENPRTGYGERRGMGSCDLFEAKWDAGRKTFLPAQNLGRPNTRGWESQPTLSADGQLLIFVRSGNHPQGGKWQDLYTSKRKDDGTWSDAVPLPGRVNTPFHEEYPVLHPDGVSLYFASDGHPGFGGLDLFVSRLQPNGEWGEPVNLGYPINTLADENSLLVAPDGRLAFFASDRLERGNLDIWQLELPEGVAPRKLKPLVGRVIDHVSRKPLEAEVQLKTTRGEGFARVWSDSRDGVFSLPMPENEALTFVVDVSGYAFHSSTLTSDRWKRDTLQIELVPWGVGTTLVLKGVLYATNSAELTDVFQADLEQLVLLLRRGNERIRITGHTDSTGSDAFNVDLSERRAAAVKNYLVARGIDASRLVTAGRGAAEPVASNDTEAGRALNRRTEITVIE